jgi:hypothetical protein
MSDDSSSGRAHDAGRRPVSAGAELIIPVTGSAFALYYFTTIWNSPWTAQVSAFFIGSLLILFSSFVVARILLRRFRGDVRLDLDVLIEPRDFLLKRIVLLGLAIAYVIMMQIAGFALTTFGFLVAAISLLKDGKDMARTLVLSAIIAVGGWALFVLAFEVHFPEGPFEILIKGIL